MYKILVVCSQNKWRSPTAEAIYRHNPRLSIRSAGLSKNSPHYLTKKDITWADLLLYMEKDHLEKINEIYPEVKLPKTVNLDVPDHLEFMNPELVKILIEKIGPLIPQDLRGVSSQAKNPSRKDKRENSTYIKTFNKSEVLVMNPRNSTSLQSSGS